MTDPATATATSAGIGAAVVWATGAPPDWVVIAAIAGALVSAWRSERTPDPRPLSCAVGGAIHMLMAFGVGMSCAMLGPDLLPLLRGLHPAPLAFVGALLSHMLVQEAGKTVPAIGDRLRSIISGAPTKTKRAKP